MILTLKKNFFFTTLTFKVDRVAARHSCHLAGPRAAGLVPPLPLVGLRSKAGPAQGVWGQVGPSRESGGPADHV